MCGASGGSGCPSPRTARKWRTAARTTAAAGARLGRPATWHGKEDDGGRRARRRARVTAGGGVVGNNLGVHRGGSRRHLGVKGGGGPPELPCFSSTSVGWPASPVLTPTSARPPAPPLPVPSTVLPPWHPRGRAGLPLLTCCALSPLSLLSAPLILPMGLVPAARRRANSSSPTRLSNGSQLPSWLASLPLMGFFLLRGLSMGGGRITA